LGLPGNWWMAGSIPADLVQFFMHVVVILQKLAYLHGWPDFFEEDAEPDDETLLIFSIFVGVMFGVGSAAKLLADLAERVGEQVLKRLPRQALTKWGFYRLAKEIVKLIGIRLTKQSFARAMSKIIFILSGFVSGALTWLWFTAMSRKLHKHLETLRPHLDDGKMKTYQPLKSLEQNEERTDSSGHGMGDVCQDLIRAGQGLVDTSHWVDCLEGYPTDLLSKIRRQLQLNVEGLSEKFNRNSRYFGYSRVGGSDVLYIYVQKQQLRIDLKISRECDAQLQRLGFAVNYVNNFQGRAGWLTGWEVPHDTDRTEIVMKWMLKAFSEEK